MIPGQLIVTNPSLWLSVDETYTITNCFSKTPGTSCQSKFLPVMVFPSAVMGPHPANEEHWMPKKSGPIFMAAKSSYCRALPREGIFTSRPALATIPASIPPNSFSNLCSILNLMIAGITSFSHVSALRPKVLLLIKFSCIVTISSAMR